MGPYLGYTFVRKLQHEDFSVHVLGMEMLHLHLSVGTTFVKLENVLLKAISLIAIHYGMARAVLLLALVPAVN